MRNSYLIAAVLAAVSLPLWGQTPPRVSQSRVSQGRVMPRVASARPPAERVVAPVTAEEEFAEEEFIEEEEVVAAPPPRKVVRRTSVNQGEMQSRVVQRTQPVQQAPVMQEQDAVYEDGGYEEGYGDGYYPAWPYGGLLGPGLGRNGCRGPWFGDLEYLQWYGKGMSTPPLVSVITNANAVPPTSAIIYPTNDFFTDGRSGGRVRLGKWLNCYEQTAIFGEYFGVKDVSSTFRAESDANGNPEYGRPFIGVDGTRLIEDVSINNQLRGSVQVDATSSFNGAGIWLRRNLGCENIMAYDPCGEGEAIGSRRVDFICGYRYLRLGERINIHESLTSLVQAAPGQFEIDDTFVTRNDFNGADLGFQWDNFRGRWHLGLTTKLALGSVQERVVITGQTVTTNAANAADNGTRQGGLLAQTTNIGTYTRNEFTIVPEVGANVGFQLTDQWRLQVGYTLIYMSRVVRPGDQIDNTVNTTLIPNRNQAFVGAARPAFNFVDTDYWMQGLNAGFHFDF